MEIQTDMAYHCELFTYTVAITPPHTMYQPFKLPSNVGFVATLSPG